MPAPGMVVNPVGGLDRHGFRLIAALVPALILAAGACTATASQPAVSDAWARPSAQSGTSAAYMTIINQTGRADALTSVATPAASRAELHESMNAGGTMSMKPVQQIDVPSGGTVKLEPGGYHVMLMDLSAALAAGATIDLTLTFASGAKVAVKAPIRQP